MPASFTSPNFDAIPTELRAVPRWVLWRAVSKSSGAKPTKIPYDAKLPNSPASSTDPDTWATYEQAKIAYEEGEGYFTGIGLALSPADELAGIDIDHCRYAETGEIDPTAIELLDSLGCQYIEISPSGTGLRSFGLASALPKGARGKLNGLDVEIYTQGRYLTVTGNVARSGAALPRLQWFHELAQELCSKKTVDPETGEVLPSLAADERYAELVGRILTGDIYHDSLRDLAAAMISGRLVPGAAVQHLRALMKQSQAPRDDRWQARYDSIPGLVSSAEKFRPTDAPTIDRSSIPAGNTAQGGGFPFLHVSHMLKVPQPVTYLIDGLIEQPSLAMLYAPPGSGKSFLAIDWAASVATGTPWMGRDTFQGPVFYLAGEGHGGIQRRLMAWNLHNNALLADAPLHTSPKAAELMDADSAAGVAQTMRELSAEHGNPALLIVDTLARNMGDGDENSTKDMSAFIRGLDAIKAEFDCTVLVVHHTGHGDPERGARIRARGSSTLLGAVDASFMMKKTEDTLALVHEKAKEGELAAPIHMALEGIELPSDWKDNKGRVMRSAVLVQTEAPAMEPGKSLTRKNSEAMEALCLVAGDRGEQIDDRVQVRTEEWRKAFYDTQGHAKAGTKNTAFNRAKKSLIQIGRVQEDGDHCSVSASEGALIAARLIANSSTPRHNDTTRHSETFVAEQ
jgi:putative DNA primase/helicase